MTGRHPFFSRNSIRDLTVTADVEMGRNRLLITSALFAAAFAVVAIRLVDVTLLGERSASHLAEGSGTAVHLTSRADIVDRNGVLLATSLKTASLFANPRIIRNPGEAAAKLVNVLPDLHEGKIRSRLGDDHKFVWIKRHLTPRQQYDVNRLGIPGLEFQNEERRVYPAGKMASHLLGHTNIDSIGQMGIERKFESDLKNRQTPLQLSIDTRIQHTLRRELSRSMADFSAVGAAGIVMDVNNGEVLGMVSLPDFDPNQLDPVDAEARFNRTTQGVYEMGSTFKIFTTAMALDLGKVTMQGGYDATDPIHISRFVIRDFHAKKRWLSVPEIFMYSSNVGSAKMALHVGPAGQRKFMEKLGLLAPSPVELAEIGAPLVPARWSEISAMTISFGHGIAVSPIQLVASVAAMVNGGVLYSPTIIKRPKGRPLIGKRVIKPKTSEKIRRLLRLVVAHGTGRLANAEGYLVGGKTGTAEKVVGRRYKTKALMSSFVGAFPMNAPRYVVFAMLDEPTGTAETQGFATGGWVAAPVVGRVISMIGPMLGMRPINEEAPAIRRTMAIDVVTEKTGKRRLASF
ncbi:MAG: penicillin-binding protein 2 [Proteobacteria bacterium]|nr:penicillin-binding protein 2 [Pseudomonadota bacterium]